MNSIEFIILITITVSLSIVPWTVLFFLSKRGRGFFKRKETIQKEVIVSVQDTSTALLILKKLKKGATLIYRKANVLDDKIAHQIKLDAKISPELIVNIFEGKKTPLHDGATIINGARIESASAYITSLSKASLPRNFGTRHRSAMGLSEDSDALIIVLSEETGQFTIFSNGEYEIIKNDNELRTKLTNSLVDKKGE